MTTLNTASPAPSIRRNHNVAMLEALTAHLRANPDADVHAGLCALVLRAQGDRDQLDADQRALIGKLARDVMDTRFA